MIIANKAPRWLSIISYPTRAHGIIVKCNHMGPRAIINFMRIFKVSTKLPESRSNEGNLENFENTSEINP